MSEANNNRTSAPDAGRQSVSAHRTARKAKAALRKIASFEKQFGPSHLPLLYQAAFPLALTPDLLYRLWANFQQDINGTFLDIPWVAVADILLSSLCEEVGQSLYEMDEAVRDELLKRLYSDDNFGQQRIQELSDFLLEYTRGQLQSSDIDTRDFAQAQKLTVLAYTQPSKAAHELASTFQQIGNSTKDKTDLVRIAALVNTFANPLAEAQLKPLLTYAKGISRWAKGDGQAAISHLEKVAKNGNINVAGVDLPIPEDIREHSQTLKVTVGADYSGQRLRGRSFRGQNLVGANFSNADIRGTDFSQAILTGANFSRVQTGLQRRWVSVLVFFSLLLTVLSGLMATLVGGLVCFGLYSTLDQIPLSKEQIASTGAGAAAFVCFLLMCLRTLFGIRSRKWSGGALGLLGSFMFTLGMLTPIVFFSIIIFDNTEGLLIPILLGGVAVFMCVTFADLLRQGGLSFSLLKPTVAKMIFGGVIAAVLILSYFLSPDDALSSAIALSLIATVLDLGLFWLNFQTKRLAESLTLLSVFILLALFLTSAVLRLNQVEWLVIAVVLAFVFAALLFITVPFVFAGASSMSGTLIGALVIPVAIAVFCLLIWVSSSLEIWTEVFAIGEISLLLAALAWATIMTTAIAATLIWTDAGNRVIALIWTLLGSVPLIVGAVGCIILILPFMPATGFVPKHFFIATAAGVIIAAAIPTLGLYISWRAIAGDPKFVSIRDLALTFSARGGTSFSAADLTGADFTEAKLKAADFREANLTDVCWFHTQNLNYAYIEGGYLSSQKVQRLAVTGIGQGENFDNLDLSGIRLQDIDLSDTSFIGTNLSGANLQNANLSRARLVNVELTGANLLGARLTGAYLKDAIIGETTPLRRVECQYIFTKLPTKRSPDPGRIPADYRQILKPGELADALDIS